MLVVVTIKIILNFEAAKPMRILVVRFRQMGDAILATPLLSTLHQCYPDAEIDFVLNERIAPLFEGHPAIHRIITFSDDERKNIFTYMKKVWKTVRQIHYDAIIDMRSTVNTILFPLFSLRSHWRIGIRKPYTWGVLNHRYEGCEDYESMIDHNLRLAEPLNPTIKDRNLTLFITEKEKLDFREYMAKQGIDFNRPVILVGVTAKLEHKTWPEDRMTDVLNRLIESYPSIQLIFNYAPGREADNAYRIFDALTADKSSVFLNIEAKSPRQLAAMSANCNAYFGNEGGARHIVHAMGRPSIVVCSPMASKKTWLPSDTDIPAWGIAASDIANTQGLTYKQQYNLVTTDRVWTELQRFLQQYILEC